MENGDIFDRGIQNFRGTRDYFGDEARFRQRVINIITNSFELFGFEPLETPAIENERTLSGKYGEEGEKKRFRLALPFPQEAGLRYDQTVPLARFMAMNWNQFPLPYRRYVVGPVWRNESTQAGRLRQFTQCDFDTVGSSSPIIDAEVVALNYTVLTKLGFGPVFNILVNDRQLLEAMVSELRVFSPVKKLAIFRAWDKLAKSSRDDIRQELASSALTVSAIRRFDYLTDQLLELSTLDNEAVINRLEKSLKGNKSTQALRSLRSLSESISAMGVPDTAYTISPTLARGLDYYTGPIFETEVKEAGVGSITGGGRFDSLISAMGGPDLPACGSSFGLERVITVMEQFGLKPASSQTTQVLVTLFDKSNSSLSLASFQLASLLRLDNIATEVYTGDNKKLRSQFDNARRKNIPFVAIIGPDEQKNGLTTIKDLRTGNQQSVPTNEVVSFIKLNL